MWYDYQWIVITGGITSFVTSYFIGANDVANSFGPSVGAKTLTIAQACILAGLLEFGGAVILGGEVSDTISSGIARPETFYDKPEFFAYGMLCSLVSSSLWLFIATYNGIPVSTTHSIVGAVTGFSLVYGGDKSIVWMDKSNNFPYIKGLVPIIISWFTSPLISGILSGALFTLNKVLIINRKNSIKYLYIVSPFLLYLTFFINFFFVFYKGGKKELKWDANKSAWVSSLVSIGTVILSGVAHTVYSRVRKNKDDTALTVMESVKIENDSSDNLLKKFFKTITYGVNYDIHSNIKDDIKKIHEGVEEFDEEIEKQYRYLQIFSSSCVAFAHGANDVANAIGPFIGILYVYENMVMSTKANAPKWIFVMGGAGIVIGLFTYGYNLIKTIGVDICKMSPSRGYCIELSTALTVLIASISGIPISTTHCVVGAEIGLGLTENRHNMNWFFLRKTFFMWIITILVTGLISAGLFSQGVYSPSIQMSRDLVVYESNLKDLILNRSNNNQTLDYVNKIYNKKKYGYIEPDNVTKYLDNVCK